ncbi:hypothetical protein [Solitalea koreensis]|uniref:Viral A-type inclusion protein n=1 Tax=Solitalea koreensis TaxID=543615 RepID=A0A521BMD6_9SPHI|nr:hypothetical protein [Solitalea koreensis]SMO47931.1 hypothetical protein SAMN06265350_102297 [Solitalea koreensis]
MKKILLITFSVLFALSCSNSKMEEQKQEKALFIEMMGVHDNLMPKSEELVKSKRQLLQLASKMDSLKKVNTDLDTAALREKIQTGVAQLDSADNAMSDWMHNFDPTFEGKSHEQIMKYLEDNKMTIKKVEDQFTSSLNNANQVLNDVKKQ